MFRSYDPGLVTVTVGPFTIVGFHSGTFVKCERDENTWKKSKGAQGAGVRVRSRNKGGKITLTLQGVSPSNDDLTSISSDDEDPNATPETFAVSVIDGNGTTIWDAENAWVMKPADAEFADDHTPREWVIDCDELRWNNGGSTT